MTDGRGNAGVGSAVFRLNKLAYMALDEEQKQRYDSDPEKPRIDIRQCCLELSADRKSYYVDKNLKKFRSPAWFYRLHAIIETATAYGHQDCLQMVKNQCCVNIHSEERQREN